MNPIGYFQTYLCQFYESLFRITCRKVERFATCPVLFCCFFHLDCKIILKYVCCNIFYLKVKILIQERMDYLEDGKTVFRLRLRLCSSLCPVNERIRDFFVEYDRHTLHTSPPWGSELLEVSLLLLNGLDWSFC